MQRKAGKRDSQISALTALVLVSQVGLVMVLPVVAGVAGGIWLDRRLHGGGLVLAGMILLGIGGGIMATVRLLIREIPWNHSEHSD